MISILVQHVTSRTLRRGMHGHRPPPYRMGSPRARLSCWLTARLGYRLYGQLRWWWHPVLCAQYAEFCTGYVNYVASQETNDPEEAATAATEGYRDARHAYWLTLLAGPHLLTGCRRIRRALRLS